MDEESPSQSSASEEQEDSKEVTQWKKDEEEDACLNETYEADMNTPFSSHEVTAYLLKSVRYHDVQHQFEIVSKERERAESYVSLQEEKIKNMKQAVDAFERWLSDYEDSNRQDANLTYLPIETIEAFRPLAKHYGIFMYDDFYKKYKEADGNFKALRTVKTCMDCFEMDTWDVLRNDWLESIIGNMRAKRISWYDWYEADWCQTNRGLPSREHTRCILLGYSPDPEKLKQLIPTIEKRFKKFEAVKVETEAESEENENDTSAISVNQENLDEETKEVEHVHGLKCARHANELDAIRTFKRLHGRDVTYQFELIKHYHKMTEKHCNILESGMEAIRLNIERLDEWLENYRSTDGKETNPDYLPIETIEAFVPLAQHYDFFITDFACFHRAYKKVNGDPLALRTAAIDNCKCIGSKANWNVRRNQWLHESRYHYRSNKDGLYETSEGEFKGFPTEKHTQWIMLGYSPEPEKLQQLIPKISGKFSTIDVKESCAESAFSPIGMIHKKGHWEIEAMSHWEATDILENVITNIAGRDINLQYDMIMYYRQCAKNILTNEESYVTETQQIITDFDEWLQDYEQKDREKELLPYLPIEIIEAFRPLGKRYGLSSKGFYKTYKKVDGNYKALRCLKFTPCEGEEETTWDVLRNDQLNVIIGSAGSEKRESIVWYEVQNTRLVPKNFPSMPHMQCILWGYSPHPKNLKAMIPLVTRTFKANEEPAKNGVSKRSYSQSIPTPPGSEDGTPVKKMKTSFSQL